MLLIGILLLAGCAPGPAERPAPREDPEVAEEPEERIAAPEPDPDQIGYQIPLEFLEPRFQFPLGDPVSWAEELEPSEWVARTLGSMTLRQKVGQMIMPWVLGDFAPEGSSSFERIAQMIDEHEIGGVIVSSGTPLDVAAKLNAYQRRSSLPLLVAADLETGAGFRLRGAAHLPGGTDLGGATNFPSLMALGAIGDRFLAYELGRITAEEARAVGIHVPFAPVLDVNNNPENPIINTRSFGESPELVAALGQCFVRGVQDYGAVATGKHFPGHGDTETDSHLALPIIGTDLERLARLELVPFQETIDIGMGAIMTAHIALPSLTEESSRPATLSRNVLTGLLRERMGFDGLVFTDAMDMNAIDRLYSREEAAALAVEAGADVILMPPSPDAAIRGIMNAVLAGRIPEEQIDESVRRILRLKAEMGLHLERTVDLEAVHRRVGIPEHVEVAQEIADRSLTLLRNEGNLLPLAGTRTANVLSVTYRRANDLFGGRTFDARLRQTYPRLQSETVGRDTREAEYRRMLQRARGMDLVVVSLHITAVSYAGSVAAPDELVDFVRELARIGVPNVAISFGNPYLLSEFPEVRSYLLAWSGSQVSQRAAAGALVGDVAVRGRTPTRIPPSHEIGDGIQLRTGGGVAASEISASCE